VTVGRLLILILILILNDIRTFGVTDRAAALNIPVELELNRTIAIALFGSFPNGAHP
jgi:hypothetical protein